MKQTGTNADVFTVCIQHILKREEMWNLWKYNGCPDFSRSKLDLKRKYSRDSNQLSKKLRESIEKAAERRKMNFEDLRHSSQQYIPTIQVFFTEIIEKLQSVKPSDFQDAKELEKEREKLFQQDPSFVWRALRLLARQSPYFFVHNTQTVPSMAQFLVSTCEKIRREYPSETTLSQTTDAAPTPPPATSTTNPDDEEEDTTMDDEPLENPPSTGETTNTDQEVEEEATTTTTTTNVVPKVEEDDDDDNRERRFNSTKRTSVS